jgi:hypothetical protein
VRPSLLDISRKEGHIVWVKVRQLGMDLLSLLPAHAETAKSRAIQLSLETCFGRIRCRRTRVDDFRMIDMTSFGGASWCNRHILFSA